MPVSSNIQGRQIRSGELDPVVVVRILDGVNIDADLQVGGADVSNANPVPVSDAGGSLTVDDGGLSLTVDQATHDLLNANANIQVGDVDVANANPVPVSDAGGSLTVDQGAAGVAAWLAAITAIAAGETHIGAVGGHCYTTPVYPVLTVAGAYVSGDYVGTSATAMTFANAVRITGGTGVIESAVLIDKAVQSASIELWLFDAAPTPPADNAAWTISDGDALQCIGVIPFQVYYASALNSVSFAKGLGMTFNANAATRDIYGCFVTRGTPTYASLDLLCRLQILQD